MGAPGREDGKLSGNRNPVSGRQSHISGRRNKGSNNVEKRVRETDSSFYGVQGLVRLDGEDFSWKSRTPTNPWVSGLCALTTTPKIRVP